MRVGRISLLWLKYVTPSSHGRKCSMASVPSRNLTKPRNPDRCFITKLTMRCFSSSGHLRNRVLSVLMTPIIRVGYSHMVPFASPYCPAKRPTVVPLPLQLRCSSATPSCNPTGRCLLCDRHLKHRWSLIRSSMNQKEYLSIFPICWR